MAGAGTVSESPLEPVPTRVSYPQVALCRGVDMQKKESMKAGDLSDNCALDVLIQTGLANPIAIALAESLLREAGVSFFVMAKTLQLAKRVVMIWGGGAYELHEIGKTKRERFHRASRR
jgi:hypothetical protein